MLLLFDGFTIWTCTLKSELSTAKTYGLISTDEKSVFNKHCSDIDIKFAVGITKSQEKLPTFYWLPKLHKRPHKARFIGNSSSCSTTSLSKVLTSCLTAIKNHWIKYGEKTYEREGINYFWSVRNSTEILNKLKTKGFQASDVILTKGLSCRNLYSFVVYLYVNGSGSITSVG